jgi:plasmid stability protein
MRTTVDIPDELYRDLKIKAAREGKPVRQIVLRGIQREVEPLKQQPARKKFQIPVIRSAHPGTLHLTNEDIDEILASS